jgi:hypothetical protein
VQVSLVGFFDLYEAMRDFRKLKYLQESSISIPVCFFSASSDLSQFIFVIADESLSLV